MNKVALGDLSDALLEWFTNKFRVDDLSLDGPDPNLEPIGNGTYPPNNATALPPARINYVQSNFGMQGAAEFTILLNYQFPGSIPYHDLPHRYLANLLNNTYYHAILSPASIHPAIMSARTPDQGVDIVVDRAAETDSDWVVQLQINIYLTFKAQLGSLGPLQPPDEETPFVLRRLRINIHRARAGDFEDNRLDRQLEFNYTQ